MASLAVMFHGANGANLSFSKSDSVMGTRISKINLLQWSPARSRVSNGKRFGLCVEAKIREIFMPALSSTMTEGKIVSWIKSEGETLSKGESVVVVESDKADMDVETFYDGILAAIVVGEGEVAPVGAPIGLLAENEEEVAEAKAKANKASAPSSSGAPPPPPETTPVPAPSPASASASAPTHTPAPAPPSDAQGPRRIIVTPYAKKLAKQYKIDLANVIGTGPNGRITPADIEAAAGVTPSPPSPPVSAPPPPPPPPSATSTRTSSTSTASSAPLSGTTVPFTTMQSAVARNMVESLAVPTFRVGYSITTNALDALYKKIKSKGVTMTALLAKATALALVQHPVVNASCKDGKSFTYSSSINIAVAVAMDGGLITPVLQDADKMDLYLLSQRWKELVDKARAKQLQPQEYNSGTFTLSNLGMFGVDRFDAILPPGQGAIMAVGASKPTVAATGDGFLGVKSKMQVNVTADHRIIYGAELAAFLQTFAKIVENPEGLTL